MDSETFTSMRQNMGFTQDDMAKFLNVSKRQVANFEDGTTKIKEVYAEKISSFKNATPSKTSTLLPLYLHPSCAGYGDDMVTDEIDDMIEVSHALLNSHFAHPEALKGYICVKVSGDSMQPTFNSGDIVIVDTKNRGGSDGVYVLNINNSFFVKRIRYSPVGEKVEVISDNPLYKAQVVNGEWLEYNELNVTGKVIAGLCRYF